MLLLAAWSVSHGVAAELDAVWLSLAPVFVLLLALVSGRYVGEETIARLTAARHRPAPRRAAGSAPRVRRRPVAQRSGGLLLARRLAGRAPPRLAPAA